MGHELWFSPLTGYRRRGTRLAELHKLLGNGITALAILEPVQSCPLDALAKDMSQVLADRDFDVAGVQEAPDGPVIGFVHRESLTGGHVRDHLQQLTADGLTSDSTALATLLKVFKNRPSTFVLIGSEVRGIVTRADLNKPPVRVYLFGLISLLEMHLSFWVRQRFEENWHEMVPRARLARAKNLHKLRRARNEQVSLIDCLQFCDKSDLLLREMDMIESLGLGTTEEGKIHLKRAEDLRNRLAHSQYDIRGDDWQNLITLVEWIESTLHTSDQLVEEKSRLTTAQFQNYLFATT
jgi:hypothetical protein